MQCLALNYDNQIKELIHSNQKEQAERERLSLALLRKEEQITYK